MNTLAPLLCDQRGDCSNGWNRMRGWQISRGTRRAAHMHTCMGRGARNTQPSAAVTAARTAAPVPAPVPSPTMSIHIGHGMHAYMCHACAKPSTLIPGVVR